MSFHVQLSGKGFTLNTAVNFNQTREEIDSKFVKLWGDGETIVVQGKPFDPHDSEIRIYEFDGLTDDESRNSLGWTRVATEGREVTGEFITFAPGARARQSSSGTANADPRNVAVIYGRDGEATEWLFDFLRALDLRPLEWMELVRATGSGSPFNREVIDGLFTLASAAVVLLTPDEECRLHPQLVPAPDLKGDGSWRGQPRCNVLLEAGMALALRPERTIFVEIGPVGIPSDIDGMSRVHMDGTAGPLYELAGRLEDAQCSVRRDGRDWLDVARLERLAALQRLPNMQKATHDEENGAKGELMKRAIRLRAKLDATDSVEVKSSSARPLYDTYTRVRGEAFEVAVEMNLEEEFKQGFPEPGLAPEPASLPGGFDALSATREAEDYKLLIRQLAGWLRSLTS